MTYSLGCIHTFLSVFIKTKISSIPRNYLTDGTLCRDSKAQMSDAKVVAPKATTSKQTQEFVYSVILEDSLECEDEKYKGIGDVCRIRELLTKKMFHCEGEYHYFRPTSCPEFPAFKVKTSLLEKHKQEVFPADYKPRRAPTKRGKRGGKSTREKFYRNKRRKFNDERDSRLSDEEPSNRVKGYSSRFQL